MSFHEKKTYELMIKAVIANITNENPKYYYQNFIDYNYDTIRPCRENDNICLDMCRCGKVINCKINSISIHNLLKYESSENKIFDYCVERILVTKGFCNFDNWDHYPISGYYGEEGFSFSLSKDILDEIKKHFDILLSKKTDLLL